MNALSRAFLFVFLAITAAFGVFSVPAAEGQNPPVLRIERPAATANETVLEGGIINFAVYAMNVSAVQSNLPVTLYCSGGAAYGALANCEATIPAGSNSVQFDVPIPDDNIDNTQSSFEVRIVDQPHYNLSAGGSSGAPTPVWIQPIVDDEDIQLSFVWGDPNTGGTSHAFNNNSNPEQVFGYFRIRNNSTGDVNGLELDDYLTNFIPRSNGLVQLTAVQAGHELTNCGPSVRAPSVGPTGRLLWGGFSVADGATCVAKLSFHVRQNVPVGIHSYQFKMNFTRDNIPTGITTRPSNHVFLRPHTGPAGLSARPLLRFSRYDTRFDDPTNFVIPEDAGQVEILWGLYDSADQDDLVTASKRVQFRCEIVGGSSADVSLSNLCGSGSGSTDVTRAEVGAAIGTAFRINVVNDTVLEGDETFTVRIYDFRYIDEATTQLQTTNLPYTDTALTGSSDIYLTFTIRDNDEGTRADGKERVSMSPSRTITVDEYVGRVNITARTTSSVDETSSVRYEIEPVTASEGFDYEGNSGIVSWSRNQTLAYFSIPITRDLTDELTNSETFIVRLTDPQGDVFLGDNVTLTVTITDSDDPIVRFEGPERGYEPNRSGLISPRPTRAFGEDYRFSVVNSRGDLVTVAERFNFGHRWTEPHPNTYPSGVAIAINDDLGLATNATYMDYVDEADADYNLSSFRGDTHVYPGIIYDNVSLSSGKVYHDDTEEAQEIFYYTALWRNGYTGWEFEDHASGNPRRRTITTTIIDNDATKHVDLFVKGSGFNDPDSTYAEVNEGDGRVYFSIVTTPAPAPTQYSVIFNINETGGDHFPNTHTLSGIQISPTTYEISIQDDMMDEPDSTVIISLDSSNLPTDYAIRNRTVTVLIRDNDEDEPLMVDLDYVNENGVPFGDTIATGITEGDSFRVRVSLSDGEIPPIAPLEVDVTLYVVDDNLVDGILSSEGLHSIPVTIPAGETSGTSQLFTTVDDDIRGDSSEGFLRGWIPTPASGLYESDSNIVLQIREDDPPAGEVFYLDFVDGNGNQARNIVEGESFYIQFEADNLVPSPVTLTYSLEVRADHIAGFPADEPQIRTVTVARDESSVLAGPFTLIDDDQRDIPAQARLDATLMSGAGYSRSSHSGGDHVFTFVYDNDAFPEILIFTYKGSDVAEGRFSFQTNVTEGEDIHLRVEYAGSRRIPRSFAVPVSVQLQTFGNLFEGFAPDEVREVTLTIPAGESGAEMTLRTTDNNLRDDTIPNPPSAFPQSWCASSRPGIETGDRCGGVLFANIRQRPDLYKIDTSTRNTRAVVVDNDPDAPPANTEYTIIPTASSPVIEGEDNAVIRFDFVPPELEADITFTVSIDDSAASPSPGRWFGRVETSGSAIVSPGFLGEITLTAATNTGSCTVAPQSQLLTNQGITSTPVSCSVSMDDSGATLTVEVRDDRFITDSNFIAPVSIYGKTPSNHRYAISPNTTRIRIVEDDSSPVIAGNWSVFLSDILGDALPEDNGVFPINEGEVFSVELDLDTTNTYTIAIDIPVELTQRGGEAGIVKVPGGFLQPDVPQIHEVDVSALSSSSSGFTVESVENLSFHEDVSVSVRVLDGSQYNVSPTGGTATVTINDDETPPVPVSVYASRESINEGGVMFFTVVADSVVSSTRPTPVTLAIVNEGRNWVQSPELTAVIPPNRNTGIVQAEAVRR